MWKQSRGPRLERRRENKRLWRTLASATAASLWLATGPRPASATGTNIYWDPNGAGSPGGSGIWDLNALDWSNLAAGGSDTAWPNFAPSSAQAVFGGTAGTVSLYSGFGSIQLNGITFQNDTTINGPLSGFATLNISGSAPSINVNSFDATINAPLSGSGGFAESGTGTLTLGGDNSRLHGTVTVNGNIVLSSASAGSANATWNFGGGTLTYDPALGGKGKTIRLGGLSGSSGTLTNSGTAGPSDVITFEIGGGGQNTGFGGTIADSPSGDRTALTKVANPTIGVIGGFGNQSQFLPGINTYTGPTSVLGGALAISGSISKSSSINVGAVGPVTNSNFAEFALTPVSAGLDQVGDTTPVTLNGTAELLMTGLSTDTSETIGAININAGENIISIGSSGSAVTTLTSAGLSRPAGGGILSVAGTNLGLNTTATTNINRILLTIAPPLVGSGAITTADTPAQKNTPIVPYMVGASGTASGAGGNTGTPNTFVTYSPAGGLRPLNPTDEFTSFGAGLNVRVAGAPTVASNLSINSLAIDLGTITVGAGATLDIATGAILANAIQRPAISGGAGSTLSFGGGEAFISAWGVSEFATRLPVTVAPNLANLTRLNIFGTSGNSGGEIVLSQGSDNTDSAPVNLMSAALSVAFDYNLGHATGSDAITFAPGSTAQLILTGTTFSSTKPISLLGNGMISVGQSATLGGPITGPGDIQFRGSGTITVTGPLTYTGITAVDAFMLKVSGGGNNPFATSPKILVGSSGSGVTLDLSGMTAPGGFRLVSGQLLAGSGTLVPPTDGLTVSTGATISAGNGSTTTGKLTTSGAQTWDGGATYLWKIDLTNAGTGNAFNSDKTGAHWDQLTMNSLSVAATAASPFNIQVLGLTGTGTNAFDPTKGYQWVAANAPAGAFAGTVNALNLSLSGFENEKIPGQFWAVFDGTSDPGFTDLVVVYTPTPEPGTFFLLAPVASGLLLSRRRRRAGAQ